MGDPAPQAAPEIVDSSPPRGTVIGVYIVVVLGCVGAWILYTQTDPQPLIVDVEGFSIFAPLYIAAQAIERFLEPLAARVGVTTGEKSAVRQAKEALATSPTSANRRAVETAEAGLAAQQAKRALWLWAAASVLGLAVCAMLGLGLIEAVAKQRPGSEYLRTVDVLLTGLAVGAGTKPLHDLIARIEKAKDNADAASSPATT